MVEPSSHPGLRRSERQPDAARWGSGTHLCIVTPRIAPVGEAAGSIRLGTLDLPVFGCVGDVQSAAAGTGFPKAAQLLVNLGTGSQVLRSTPAIPIGIERRPGADGADF